MKRNVLTSFGLMMSGLLLIVTQSAQIAVAQISPDPVPTVIGTEPDPAIHKCCRDDILHNWGTDTTLFCVKSSVPGFCTDGGQCNGSSVVVDSVQQGGRETKENYSCNNNPNPQIKYKVSLQRYTKSCPTLTTGGKCPCTLTPLGAPREVEFIKGCSGNPCPATPRPGHTIVGTSTASD